MKKKAFTLIELIAVLVILAILALIVTPLVMNIIRKAKISADKRSVDAYGRSVELAIATHVLDTGTFPTDLNSLTIEYTGKEVVCNVMQMKENGEVYLSECTVGGKDVKDSKTEDGWYHYGSFVKQRTAVEDLLEKANNDSVINYTDGNTKEMYTFSHPATTQTGALTDYRYIGANPNNYVIFNNELWRIIGVFTVEDGNGNAEQRIKIVRNEKLSSDMAWDSNGVNEWSAATLNTYLNGEYYDGLDEFSKNIIVNSKFYLGGGQSGSPFNHISAEEMYDWERGTEVYSGNSTSWNGKIALIYPSDYLYTYALGVDNTCYTGGYLCSTYEGATPTNGWIYNTNSNSFQKLLSPIKTSSVDSFGIILYGSLTTRPVSYSDSVRPSLYLISSVKFDSGDGSEQNPYILKL